MDWIPIFWWAYLVLTQIGIFYMYRFCLLRHNHKGRSDSV